MVALAFLFVSLHLLFWGLILLVQEIEEHEGRIPRRNTSKLKPFRYLQDWHTATWGDWVGLSLLNAVAGYVFVYTHLPLVAAATLVGFVGASVFHMRAMGSRHRPDAGYPASGTISLSGMLHLVYFFVECSIAAYIALLALTGQIQGIPLYAAVVGGCVYMLTLLFDIRDDKFALLKK